MELPYGCAQNRHHGRVPDLAAADALSLLWVRQSIWSQTANRLKKSISRARTTVLGLTIVAAVLGTAATELTRSAPSVGRALALVAAVALGLTALVGQGARRQAMHDWTRARSVSESLKSEVYQALAGVTPYRGGDVDEQLLKKAETLSDDAGDLVRLTADVAPVERPLPPVHDLDSYVLARVNGQIADYYRPGARRMARRSAASRRAQFGLAAVGVALTATAGITGTNAATAWVAVLTTVSVAAAAHATAERYEYQQLEFTRTADELERLRVGRRPGASPAADDAFVAACERIISIQNEAWMVATSTEERKG